VAVDAGAVRAPLPGKIIDLRVKAGDTVSRGQPLLVLEAMKMEHTLAAPADGTVKSVRYAVGEQVPEGAELVEFE
jgi:3-methylcrotonyl-CoA carboxylase alpha subunit